MRVSVEAGFSSVTVSIGDCSGWTSNRSSEGGAAVELTIVGDPYPGLIVCVISRAVTIASNLSPELPLLIRLILGGFDRLLAASPGDQPSQAVRVLRFHLSCSAIEFAADPICQFGGYAHTSQTMRNGLNERSSAAAQVCPPLHRKRVHPLLHPLLLQSSSQRQRDRTSVWQAPQTAAARRELMPRFLHGVSWRKKTETSLRSAIRRRKESAEEGNYCERAQDASPSLLIDGDVTPLHFCDAQRCATCSCILSRHSRGPETRSLRSGQTRKSRLQRTW